MIGNANSDKDGMLIPKNAKITMVIKVVVVVNKARLRH